AARDGGFRDGGPGAVRDGGAEVPRDAGVRVIVGGERESGGCGCTTHEKRGGAPWFALIGVFWLVRRRRPHV
ncbi:MAG: MYXO-CTERM sorting domain-containing protein, partial [Deltaproteobacteria bacterium]